MWQLSGRVSVQKPVLLPRGAHLPQPQRASGAHCSPPARSPSAVLMLAPELGLEGVDEESAHHTPDNSSPSRESRCACSCLLKGKQGLPPYGPVHRCLQAYTRPTIPDNHAVGCSAPCWRFLEK